MNLKCVFSLALASALSLVAMPTRADTVDIDLAGFSAFQGYHGIGSGPNSGVSINIGAGSEIVGVEFIDLTFTTFGASWQSELVLSVNDDDGIPDGGIFDDYWDYLPSGAGSPGTFGPASGSFGDFPDQEDGGPFVATSGDLWITVYDTFQDNANPDVTITSGTLRIHYISSATTTVDGFVYHSSWAGDPKVDTGKTLAVEGGGPTALTYSNLINTSQGINGLLFEFDGLPNPGSLSAADFTFQMSPQGGFDSGLNPPAGWVSAPAPSSVSVTPGTPTTALVQWPNNSIENRWLRVTIAANGNTGLSSPKTFYLGHLLGETTGGTSSPFQVTFADITPIRSDVGLSAPITSITDIDKSGTVTFGDISAMRTSVGSVLTIITIP